MAGTSVIPERVFHRSQRASRQYLQFVALTIFSSATNSGGIAWMLRAYGTLVSNIPGDIDEDRDVDRTDAASSRFYGLETGSFWNAGDFDGDGSTTLADWAILQLAFWSIRTEPGGRRAGPQRGCDCRPWVVGRSVVSTTSSGLVAEPVPPGMEELDFRFRSHTAPEKTDVFFVARLLTARGRGISVIDA